MCSGATPKFRSTLPYQKIIYRTRVTVDVEVKRTVKTFSVNITVEERSCVVSFEFLLRPWLGKLHYIRSLFAF